MLDGGPGAEPSGRLDAWLLTDDRAELVREIRAAARRRGVEPGVGRFERGDLRIEPRPVVHTSHPTFGYRIQVPQGVVVWAPELLAFPTWARGADLMFAEAASWSRPIWFAGKVGGHASALDVCAWAKRYRVKRLVLAHLGRPTLRALDAGATPPYGEIGREGAVYRLPARRSR